MTTINTFYSISIKNNLATNILISDPVNIRL